MTSPRTAAARWIHPSPGTLAMGVEEELLLVDALTLEAAPGAPGVLESCRTQAPGQVSAEITTLQVEVKSNPQVRTEELRGELLSLRRLAARCAEQDGLKVVASGLPVLGDVVPPPITEGARYAMGTKNYRALHDEQSMCACHVHIDCPDLDQALQVSNRLRPWLPVLLAMTANSPYFAGRDTGYASWRTLAWGRWPVAGPPPYFHSPAHYEEVLAVLGESGALVDPATVFWDVRPAPRLPTLEVRVADMTGTVGESVVLAALVRALVAVALRDAARGGSAPAPSAEVMRAAYWRAARDGLDGTGLDVVSGKARPARALVEAMVAYAWPALEQYGDAPLVAAGLRRLFAVGCGAARQRAAAQGPGALASTVRHQVEQTLVDWTVPLLPAARG
ncbi:carboxylate-amine ligase [Streptomyces melanogenes]|uniref:carboxylate-amine ligase n=1 Tax=Streptomyces melanogenes TaxID=67326 RepID=UPI00198FB912|nr:glutamate--cysteine ligase [Streptomyces melanogenes]GGP89389.1 putative glutamate--cysteine ligase 2-3 [Streptomyces melanogenes]